jgi:hypothetical protein
VNKIYTDDQLQAYRHRLVARMNALEETYPGEDDEAAHDHWCSIFHIWMKRYNGIEDMLVERGVELEPLDPGKGRAFKDMTQL